MTIQAQMPIPAKPRPKSAAPWKVRGFSKIAVTTVASLLPAAMAITLGIFFDFSPPTILVILFLPLQIVIASIAALMVRGKRGMGDAALTVIVYFALALVTVLLGSVVVSVITWGAKAMSLHFLYQNDVYITPSTSLEYGGIGHAMIGSLVTVALVTVVTVPISIAIAVYLTEGYGRLRGAVRFFTQAMSGLPSVVSGLFIYAAFISIGSNRPAGWLGSAALLLLMLPTVTRMSEEVLKLVPNELRSAALALGAPRRRAFFQVIMPAARTGLVTAVLLGLARIVGETAPLLLTIDFEHRTNANPLSGGMATMTTYIYSYLGAGYDTSRQRSWGAALVLLGLVAILFGIARLFANKKVGSR